MAYKKTTNDSFTNWGLEETPEGSNANERINMSIAISLKRIADALCETRPYENPISRAINEGIANGAQDWIGHMARNGR